MYEIPKVTSTVAGAKQPEADASAADREELLSILGLENFLAISGIEISQLAGVGAHELGPLLARNGIDIAQLDRAELVDLIETYRK